MDDSISRPLRVASLVATRRGEEDRGPMVWMHPDDAGYRLLVDGELAWIYGPRRHELATVRIDPSITKGEVVLRDVVGASPSEIVRVIKPDLDNRSNRGVLA